MLALLAIAAVSLGHGPLRPDGPELPPAPARVEVASGRALIVGASGVETVAAGGPTAVVEGRAHLEVLPGSVATLRFPGYAALRLTGPAAIEWEPSAGDPIPLRWRVLALDRADLSVRRAWPRLELPGGWTLRAAPGAYHLRGSAAGFCELEQHGGLGARLLGPPAERGERRLYDVPVGRRLRLAAPAERPPLRRSAAQDSSSTGPRM